MKMLEIYRLKKENLADRLASSQSLYETCSVINEAFESMTYQYLAKNGRQLEFPLKNAVDIARASFPLLESARKYRLWENAGAKKKRPAPGLICAFAGFALVFLTLGYYMFLYDIKLRQAKNWLLAVLAGCLLIFISGFMLFFRRKAKISVEISADISKALGKLEETAKEIDKFMDRYLQRQQRQQARQSENTDPQLMQLFSYLLEGKLSGDADFMSEQISLAEEYLGQHGILVLEYEKGREAYFDFLPSRENKTIRPAIVKNGALLVRGLAGMIQQ